MASRSPTTSAAAAAAASIANCGSLGVALQQALEEIRQQHEGNDGNDNDNDSDSDKDGDFWNQDHADRILEALGNAVAATTIPNRESTITNNYSEYSESYFADDTDGTGDDAAGQGRQRPQYVLTATVDYYNRLGDRWRIVTVADSAQLQVPPPPSPPVPRPDGYDEYEYEYEYDNHRTNKRKRSHQIHAFDATPPVQLPRLEVLAYKKDYSK